MLAGMNAVAHAVTRTIARVHLQLSGWLGQELVAAVTNAGGIGTIGGLLLSPNALKKQIDEAKLLITDKLNPKFGARS